VCGDELHGIVTTDVVQLCQVIGIVDDGWLNIYDKMLMCNMVIEQADEGITVRNAHAIAKVAPVSMRVILPMAIWLPVCHKTFGARSGTLFHRRRTDEALASMKPVLTSGVSAPTEGIGRRRWRTA
jgi:hypothetical protein